MKLNNFFTPNVRDGWFGSVFFLYALVENLGISVELKILRHCQFESDQGYNAF